MSALFLSLTVILLFYVYKLLVRKHDIFKRRGVVYQNPIVLFGNMFNAFVSGESLDSVIGILYEKFQGEKLFGVFVLHRPIFVIKDIGLIDKIGSSDNFSSYSGHEFDELKLKPKNNKQPDSRKTTGTKSSLNTIFKCSSVAKFELTLLKCARNSLSLVQRKQQGDLIEFEAKDVLEKFIAESIASKVFGNSESEKIDEVLRIAKFINEDLTTLTGSAIIMTNTLLPQIFRKKLFRKEIHEYFCKILNLSRKDGKREKTENNNDNDDQENYHQVFEQLLNLFSGGFNATRKLLQSCLLELCTHQDIQAELIKEIDEAKIHSHQSLTSLKLLNKVINETLRKFPPIKSLTRICTQTCSLTTENGEVLKFVENDVIHIPIALIQNDSKIIREPEKFNPLRTENDQFLFAFGLGSNRCSGANFVVLQAKALIFTFLNGYFIKSHELIDEENFILKVKCR